MNIMINILGLIDVSRDLVFERVSLSIRLGTKGLKRGGASFVNTFSDKADTCMLHKIMIFSNKYSLKPKVVFLVSEEWYYQLEILKR